MSLFPEFDAKIIEKIEETNDQAQVLFATVERGSSAAEFASLEPTYNEVLGGLSAVLLQVEARPQPETSERLINRIVGRERIQDLCRESEDVPADDPRACFLVVTPSALKEARKSISEMRNAHERLGLGPVLAENYRNLFNISIEQALTVEAALAVSAGGI
ncbi:hypothetical protein [Paracoccus sp. SCSIO 75233]|uniref:hypothetical protein n=1 Tax=Paracoccus sp. SCSIO 75233 TaxID=3017782 RepID=UPI0022F1349A|nr:hypothetical protein [Paracoccus sp. SCSIO 75233]WBU53574.1 hypothetical protein PAF12_01675 [Paracoccus sp. SCSIO 75233]